MRSFRSTIGAPLLAILPVLALSCAAEYADSVDPDDEAAGVGEASQAVAACAGDDLQYDFNAFAASLAVASAKELGRWEASTDFEVRNGKLELSATGELHCGAGCGNIRALLRLQDDAASSVPYHSPSVYRSKLTTWHQRQKTELTTLVDKMLTLDKGIYRLKNRQSGKYMQVDGGSTSDNAAIEQRTNPAQTGADQWRVVLDHGWHKLINVRSGKCIALSQTSGSNNVSFVQKTCASSDQQRFNFANMTNPYYTVRIKGGQALDVKGASTADDAPVVQYVWGSAASQQWALESVGTTIKPEVLASAMYMLTPRHSGKAVAVDNGSANDNALIEQSTYSATDDRFQWFVVRSGETRYNLVNRRSGKCLDLQSASATGRLVQRACSQASTQWFTMLATGDGHHVIYSVYGKPLEIEGSSTASDAVLAQASGSEWNMNRQFALTPVLAGEPHRLTFSHATDDGPCGDYFWYDIKQPNGLALRSPADSFVQLIFAGGKTTATGRDENPFIAQQVNGNQVAIDPSGYMNGGTLSATGACYDTDILYDASGKAAGSCCVRYTGVIGKLKQSTWSTTTFLCQ